MLSFAVSTDASEWSMMVPGGWATCGHPCKTDMSDMKAYLLDKTTKNRGACQTKQQQEINQTS